MRKVQIVGVVVTQGISALLQGSAVFKILFIALLIIVVRLDSTVMERTMNFA